MSNLEYVTADLESPLADVKMDIRQMPFETDSFDVLLCNHVLEHIDDEAKALAEIKRVLKPGGWAILQVPVDYQRETTYEDPTVTDPKDREKRFGQYDHLRVHGRDYPRRLQNAGFRVDQHDFLSDFNEADIQYFRLPEKEIIYVCYKP